MCTISVNGEADERPSRTDGGCSGRNRRIATAIAQITAKTPRHWIRISTFVSLYTDHRTASNRPRSHLRQIAKRTDPAASSTSQGTAKASSARLESHTSCRRGPVPQWGSRSGCGGGREAPLPLRAARAEHARSAPWASRASSPT